MGRDALGVFKPEWLVGQFLAAKHLLHEPVDLLMKALAKIGCGVADSFDGFRGIAGSFSRSLPRSGGHP